jgi:glycerate 2-kinase
MMLSFFGRISTKLGRRQVCNNSKYLITTSTTTTMSPPNVRKSPLLPQKYRRCCGGGMYLAFFPYSFVAATTTTTAAAFVSSSTTIKAPLPLFQDFRYVLSSRMTGRTTFSTPSSAEHNNRLTTHRWLSSSSSSSSSSPLEQEMTRHALQIVESAINAVSPYTAIRNSIQRRKDDDNDDAGVIRIRTSLRYNNNAIPDNDANDDDDDDDGQVVAASGTWQEIRLQEYQQIVVVAFGKASSAMATATVQQLYSSHSNKKNMVMPPCQGVVICKDNHVTPEELQTLQQNNIQVLEASHPIPDQRSVQATKTLLQLVTKCASPTTLILCLISGGGSALLCQPAGSSTTSSSLTLQDIQVVNSLLLASGMDIQQMNIIRKKLEPSAKGGGLAKACYPSHVISLILSDVLGDPLDLIASGPTVPDQSSWQDAWEIIEQYNLDGQLPKAVVQLLIQGQQQEQDTRSQDDISNNCNNNINNNNDKIFMNCQTVLIGNNALAVQGAAEQAERLGYHPVILGTEMEGEAKVIAKIYVCMARYLLQNNYHANHQGDDDQSRRQLLLLPRYAVASSLPVALIAGGETTVTLNEENDDANNKSSNNNNKKTNGQGGRNQELALSAALQFESLRIRNVVLASVGTDGGDGPTDAAGAVVDGTTISTSNKLEALHALTNHDAYTFFDAIGKQQEISSILPPLIKTGPTGTNVADICVTLIHGNNGKVVERK